MGYHNWENTPTTEDHQTGTKRKLINGRIRIKRRNLRWYSMKINIKIMMIRGSLIESGRELDKNPALIMKISARWVLFRQREKPKTPSKLSNRNTSKTKAWPGFSHNRPPKLHNNSNSKTVNPLSTITKCSDNYNNLQPARPTRNQAENIRATIPSWVQVT